MASWLYECLCEAGLEKYYAHFATFGLQKIDELAKISMEDYTKLGVHDINDRKRLFQLIKIIKIMRQEGIADLTKQDFEPRGLFMKPKVTRSGPRRQLHFESPCEESDGTVKDSESELYHSPDFGANEEKNSVGEMLGHIPPHDSELIRLTRRELNIPGIGTKTDLSCSAVSDDIAPLLGDSEAPIVQRVTHISGYNYGLPHSCVRSNTLDKETPWTESEKIRVCVRKRPLCLKEERRGEVNIITVKDKETLLLHEKKEAVDLTQYILQHVFYFDEVFGESCTNQDVYMKTAYPLIQHIFNGGNATCFAYGQTGAGKTYTMIGNHRNPGLYALAARDIFRHVEASPSRKDLVVLISFYEIYCGQLYDLLNGRNRLQAREDGNHVVQIVGLREVQVDSVDQLLEVILKGGKERSTGATAVNSDSSRSHAIIQIQIKDTANRAFGRISFIDLAGSERAADARDSDRQTKMEGAEINQSLLALKECIRALDQSHTHTPFRQSKLTQVLKDSFIGNSKTCMIANVSPSHIATEHTLNTLRYADRVKELKKGIRCSTPVTKRRRRARNISPKSETKEGGQQDKHRQNRTPVQCLKVQTVQPVQKQVSRDDSFGDGNLPSDSEQEWGSTSAKQCVEPWAYVPPFQKDREEHLRLYHQQFQQPPILKQKLNYQPLERFLMQYKPEEIQVKQEPSLTPTEVQSKEGMQLEDLDDSDFSEDSFSPVCSRESVKRGNTNKCSQLSFFLHEREQGTEEEQKGQKRQDLFFKYAIPTQDHGLDDSWDCSEGSPEAEESFKNIGCSSTPADWSYESLAVESSPSNTAEKPYCLQEDPACSWRNGKDFLADHKEYKSKPRCLAYSSAATLTPEKDVSNPYVSPVLKSGTPECKEIDLQHEENEESTLDKKAGGAKWKARKNGVSHCVSSSCSSECTSKLVAPLLVSSLDGEDTSETQKVSSNQEKPRHEKQVPDSDTQSRFEDEGWQCTRSRSLTDSMLELGEQPWHGGRLCALLGSPQAAHKQLPPACGRVKPCCCRLGSGLSRQGVQHGLFVGRGGTSAAGAAAPRPEREDGGLCSDSPGKEHPGGRRCGADVNQHNNGGNSGKSNSSQGSRAEEINAEIPGKSYAAPSPFQPKPGLRNEDLTRSEDPAKSSFSSEETGLLKTKLKQSIFTQETFAADAGFATKDKKPIASTKCPSHMSSSSSPSAASEMGKWQREALEKAQQTVIRAHRQQLDEMACLCFKEECLINQMSAMDFQNFMTMLDEILMLKSKCVQVMRAQLQLCLSSPGTDTSLQTPPPV
ncbi:KIF24 protein, partial [Phainopepla nitens]|nr:KIF24 protein [Phainopepla nitens]